MRVLPRALLLLTVSCGASAERPAAPPLALSVENQNNGNVVFAAAPALAIQPLAMGSVACQVETQTLYGYGEVSPKLCDASLERCFVDFDAIQAQPMRVSIGLGARPKGFAELRYQGLELRGFLDVAPVVVFPRADLRLGGFFRAMEVRIVSGSPGRLGVVGDPGPSVRTEVSLDAEVGCDSLRWDRSEWSEEGHESLGARGSGEVVRLVGRVPLRASPSGAVVATIEADQESTATAYQSEKGVRFITMRTEHGEVFGWVKKVELVTESLGSMWGSSGGGRGFAPIKTEWYGYRCPHDVPILARVDGALIEAGHVPAGKVFSVGEELTSGVLSFVLRHQRYSDFADPPTLRTPEHVKVLSGAGLGVERRAVADCERRVPGEP